LDFWEKKNFETKTKKKQKKTCRTHAVIATCLLDSKQADKCNETNETFFVLFISFAFEHIHQGIEKKKLP